MYSVGGWMTKEGREWLAKEGLISRRATRGGLTRTPTGTRSGEFSGHQ